MAVFLPNPKNQRGYPFSGATPKRSDAFKIIIQMTFMPSYNDKPYLNATNITKTSTETSYFNRLNASEASIVLS
jgi:hypothetical protein